MAAPARLVIARTVDIVIHACLGAAGPQMRCKNVALGLVNACARTRSLPLPLLLPLLLLLLLLLLTSCSYLCCCFCCSACCACHVGISATCQVGISSRELCVCGHQCLSHAARAVSRCKNTIGVQTPTGPTQRKHTDIIFCRFSKCQC